MLSLIGNTPMVTEQNVYLKLEYFNPTGSHKDRTAYFMVQEATEHGLKKGDTVIEYTSGNTGISVAWVAARMGLKSVILVPENTSPDKLSLIKLYGGEIIKIRDGEDGHSYAEELARERHGVFLAQTKNMANYRAHHSGTGPEIAEQAPDISSFVMGAGTGGTVYGAGKYLKDRLGAEIIMLLPRGSYAQEVLSGQKSEDRRILEGFTYYSVSELIQRAIEEEIVDRIIYVSSDEAIRGMRMLWKLGIPGGPTSGANYYHAYRLGKDGKKCVTIVADRITRYRHLMSELV